MTRTLIPAESCTFSYLSGAWNLNKTNMVLVKDNTDYYVSGIIFNLAGVPITIRPYTNSSATEIARTTYISVSVQDSFYIETQ